MRVLITGAGGHLGRKLFDYLETETDHDVSGLDIRPIDHPNIYQADLGGEPDWVRYIRNIDVIVHLAGNREPNASWASSMRNNMDATSALYHHAAEVGVSKVVLASSNWIHADKRFTYDTLDSNTPAGPVNPYGMSKAFCERIGEYFSKHTPLSVICMRIGSVQWTHDNQPGTHMSLGRWGQEMWLSDRDYLAGMLAAITVKDVSFAVLNLVSNNSGMRWNLEETAKILGFKPKDGSPAKVTFSIALKTFIKKTLTYTIPRYVERAFPSW